MENMEIERKFLVDTAAFDYKKYPHLELSQGYLSTAPVVRIRKEDDTYYLTYKNKNGEGIAHTEYNLPLTKEAYEHLIEKADGNIISKNRYLIPYEKYTIELDEFKAPFEGLIFAEVEFDSLEEAEAFNPPSWFKEDVTGDKRYSNAYLSTCKISLNY